MKRILALMVAALCLVALARVTMADDGATPPKKGCPVCGMFVSMFADWNGRIEFKDSTHAVFDGAKCMFKYYLDIKKYNPSKSKDDVTAIFVKDYYGKTDIDARQAFFVIWGDVYGPMGHEPIPFEKEGDAKRFLKEHGGKKILRFKDIDTSLLEALDNPP